jgi:hypothetical protein
MYKYTVVGFFFFYLAEITIFSCRSFFFKFFFINFKNPFVSLTLLVYVFRSSTVT